MQKRQILLILNTLFFILLGISISYSANAAMNEGTNYLNLDPINENQITPLSPSTRYNEADNNVKIFFTKSKDGTKAFRFYISDLVIDFGILTPTNPILRENILGIMNSSADFFSVLSFENHPLTNTGSLIIPDTTCDNGACSQYLASIWENTLTFGFGISCENLNFSFCLPDFRNGSKFKQFASVSDRESPVNIITGLKTAEKSEAKIIYKVNVSTTQPQMSYSNNINYILVPGY